MLEVDVCAQHNNGGLVVDAWWQSNIAGLLPGRRGRRRARGLPPRRRRAEQRAGRRDPGGAVHRGASTLRSAARSTRPPPPCSTPPSRSSSRPTRPGGLRDPRQHRRPAARGAGAHERQGRPGALRAVDRRGAGPGARVALHLRATVTADAVVPPLHQPHLPGPRHPDQRVRVPLGDGRLRRRMAAGRAARCSTPTRDRPQVPHGRPDLPEVFRFALDGGALDDEVQETSLGARCRSGARSFRVRRRPGRRAGLPVASAPSDPRGRRLLRERLAPVADVEAEQRPLLAGQRDFAVAGPGPTRRGRRRPRCRRCGLLQLLADVRPPPSG